MRGIDESINYDARHVAKVKKGRAWPVYKRLLGYVVHYKTRLAVAFVLAFFVAGSMLAIIMTAKTVVELVFQSDEAMAAQGAELKATIHDKTGWMEEHLGLAPERVDGAVDGTIAYLREDGMEMRAITWLAVLVLILAVIGGLARFGQEYLAAGIATRIGITLGREMYANIIGLHLRFFEQHTTGEVIARLTNDVFQAGRGLTQVFMKLMREPIKAAAFLGYALWISPALTLIGLAVLPPVFLVMMKVGQSVRKRMRRSLEKVAVLQSVAKESVTGISIVKGFCMEDHEKARMDREYAKLQRQGLKMMKAEAAIGPLTELVIMCGFVVFIVLSARAVIEGRDSGDPNALSLASLGALYVALAFMLDPVRKLSAVNNAIQGSVASAERVFDFMDRKSDIVEKPAAIELPRIQQALRFDEVHFSYDGETEVLDGIDLEVRKGEMVAVVGFSGAGKSTLAKLVPRFYDVTGGSISIDGVDIRDAKIGDVRNQISIVTQDTILFYDTVKANIAAGRQDYTDERIVAAAKAAHAHEFTEKLPKGYETNIGESGGTLSGGQRQRLAIARALIKDPAILILDEATSSLDSESEQAIQQAIEEFVVGRTTIVIAHRLSTVQRADRIVVIDKGQAAEQGTHDELMQRDGSIYRRLYEVQFASAGNGAQ